MLCSGFIPHVQSKIASFTSLSFRSQRRRYNVACPARLACRKPTPALHTGYSIFYALALNANAQNKIEKYSFYDYCFSSLLFVTLRVVALLGLYSACAIKDCFVHCTFVPISTAVVSCFATCLPCSSQVNLLLHTGFR